MNVADFLRDIKGKSRYGDQTVLDHAAMLQAIRDGRIESVVEIDR